MGLGHAVKVYEHHSLVLELGLELPSARKLISRSQLGIKV